MTKHPTFIHSWEAPSFRHYEKNLGWHITFWAVVVLIIGYQLIVRDFFGALSIAVISGLAAYLLRQRPHSVVVGVGDHGIHIDDVHVPYKNMQRFWIVDTDHHKTLNIETTAYLNHLLIVELEDQDPTYIRNLLLDVVPEHHENDPSFVQRMMHYFKM